MNSRLRIPLYAGQLLALWTLIFLVKACGGSGGGQQAVPPDPDPPPPPPPPPVSFTVELSGSQEVPPVDTAASGMAQLEVNPSTGALSGSLTVSDMVPTEAHVHSGHAGANGPILIHLIQDPSDPLRFNVPGNAALTTAQLNLLLAGGLYLNVHSAAHPPGEVRGQILPEDFSLVFAELTGMQQLPAQDTPVRGWAAITLDESASATAIVHLTLFGLGNASSVSLNEGYAGTSGPALAQLTQNTINPNHWRHGGVELDADTLAALSAGRLYLDVGTAAHPDGLLRGQFVPDGILLLLDPLSGDEEVPPVQTDATGVSALTIDLDSLAFEIHVNNIGLDHAHDAHIHEGLAGTNGPIVVPLHQDSLNAARWSAAGELEAEVMDLLLNGALYVNVHSPQHPPGEIRAQLKPAHIEVLFADLDGDQMVPPVATAASGLAAVTVDTEIRTLAAHARLSDLLMSTSGAVHRAPAGENGPERIALAQDTNDVDHWFVVGAALAEEDFEAFLGDGLYVQIASQAQPDGEIRGQLVRPPAPALPQAPLVTIVQPATGSEVSGTIELVAEVVSAQPIAELRFLAGDELIGSAASAPYSVQWDTTSIADGQVSLTAQAEDEFGNVGVSEPVTVTVANEDDTVPAMTLAQIQAQVFTPICALCHTSNVPGVPVTMNLTSAQSSFDSLVNVPSEQVPAMLRVHPGNPDDSYLIHKLEGSPQVEGDRMPQGGPFLDDDTIQGIRGWIAEGAVAAPGNPPVPPPPGY